VSATPDDPAEPDATNDDSELAQLVPLPAPRPLSVDEYRLLRFVVAKADVDALWTQLASVQVVSACSCPCLSVGLRSDGPAVPAETVRSLSDIDRDDWCEIVASGEDPDGGGVEVTLHVIGGLMYELEIWRPTGSPTVVEYPQVR
jgi:hypothetical protein